MSSGSDINYLLVVVVLDWVVFELNEELRSPCSGMYYSTLLSGEVRHVQSRVVLID